MLSLLKTMQFSAKLSAAFGIKHGPISHLRYLKEPGFYAVLHENSGSAMESSLLEVAEELAGWQAQKHIT